MRLFLFNPDHDMALAANYVAYIAKTAGQQLMHDMAWLPVCYANDGDAVLLLDADSKPKPDSDCIPRLALEIAEAHGIRFIQPTDITLYAKQISAIEPWGWNRQVAHKLQKLCPQLSHLLPSDTYLQTIRQYSSRKYAATHLLKALTSSADGQYVGKAEACTTIDQLLSLMQQWNCVVAKEPWSGSGRGLRYLEGSLDVHQLGWCQRVVKQQGCLMVEPHYHRLLDLAAEFHLDAAGKAYFDGISIFLTHNGQYQGNLVANHIFKQNMIDSLIDYSLFQQTIQLILTLIPDIYKGYQGPLGIDMMIVEHTNQHGTTANMLHPMIEVNLRQTMGHLALSLSNTESQPQLLKITRQNGHYKLNIQPYPTSYTNTETYW